MNSLLDLTAVQLRKAARLQEKIQSLVSELENILGSANRAARGGSPKQQRKGKRRMSAATKAKIAAIARARWRKAKAAGRSAL